MFNLYYYEKHVQSTLAKWHKEMMKPPSLLNKASKSIQTKTQALIPQKIQDALTLSIQKMTEALMAGSGLLTNAKNIEKMSLSESDWLVENAYKTYIKTAVLQGIGFGAGGILLSVADFPALLSIKIKFLYDCAKFYGYDAHEKSERLYLLYIFQLAFSSDAHRRKVYQLLMHWDLENAQAYTLDWEKFQIEYRDYIDLAKLLQLLPVVGAVAGGAANHRLMEKLKITAMNCYRTRFLKDLQKI